MWGEYKKQEGLHFSVWLVWVEGHFPRLSIEGEVNHGGGGFPPLHTKYYWYTYLPWNWLLSLCLVLCFGQIRPLAWTKPAKTVTTKNLKFWELDSNYKPSQWIAFNDIITTQHQHKTKLGWAHNWVEPNPPPTPHPTTTTLPPPHTKGSWFLVWNLILTQLYELWKTSSIFLKIEDDLNFFQMEDNLYFVLCNLRN